VANPDTTRRLLMYYEHTPEWWGQAIWFYNKFTGSSVPQDVFEVVERTAGLNVEIPPSYIVYSTQVLEFWGAREGLAETLLPSR
jgi:hypothetical protein